MLKKLETAKSNRLLLFCVIYVWDYSEPNSEFVEVTYLNKEKNSEQESCSL